MNELASYSIGTILVIIKLLAYFCLIKRRNVLFFLELMLSMCKSTRLAVGAEISFHPALTQLSLNLNFIVFWQYSTISLKCEGIILIVTLFFLKHLIMFKLVHPYLFCILVIFQEVVLIVELILNAFCLFIKWI